MTLVPKPGNCFRPIWH